MALSPWPSSPVALANATATLKASVDDMLDDAVVQRLGAVAAALVQNYAPDAPQVLRDEGVIRTFGWLLDSPASNLRSTTIGPISYDFAPSQRGALLHSGSKSMLYAYRRKTAGLAG